MKSVLIWLNNDNIIQMKNPDDKINSIKLNSLTAYDLENLPDNFTVKKTKESYLVVLRNVVYIQYK